MFFKHADRDPNDVTKFVLLGNLLFMLAGIKTLNDLGERSSDAQIAFGIYMAFTQPEYINAEMVDLLKQRTPADYAAMIGSMDKYEFFKMSLEGSARLRASGKIL